MSKMLIFSSRRQESKRKYKKTSIGRDASRSKMNKNTSRSYKRSRGQGR